MLPGYPRASVGSIVYTASLGVSGAVTNGGISYDGFNDAVVTGTAGGTFTEDARLADKEIAPGFVLSFFGESSENDDCYFVLSSGSASDLRSTWKITMDGWDILNSGYSPSVGASDILWSPRPVWADFTNGQTQSWIITRL
jgi:hypothetical protein